jgi:hypothetical protein
MSTTTRRPSHRAEIADRRPARATYRLLAIRGLSPAEAGNVTAYSLGIGPIDGGWTVREFERLRFLRYLLDAGRIGS